MPFEPFLLPVCACGGTTDLIRREQVEGDARIEEKIYRCATCGALHSERGKRLTKDWPAA